MAEDTLIHIQDYTHLKRCALSTASPLYTHKQKTNDYGNLTQQLFNGNYQNEFSLL